MRVWLFRMTVCVFAAAACAAGWFTYLNTNSDAIRRKVIEELQAQFVNVDVDMGSAWLQPLGGICVHDVRIIRRDDPSNPLLVVPSAVIHFDKEQLTQGRLIIRKIELQEPTLLLRRDVEANWNLNCLASRGHGDGSVPLVVVRRGTVIYEDRSGAVNRPRIEMRDVNFTVVNDPLPLVQVNGHGASPLGPLKWDLKWQRIQHVLTGNVELKDAGLTRGLVGDLSRHIPELAEHFNDFEAQGSAKFSFRFQPGGRPAFQPDLRVQLHHGRWRHPRLPLRHVENLEVKLRYFEDQLTVEDFRACSGSTEVRLQLGSVLPPAGLKLDEPQQLLNHLQLSVRNLTLSPELFARLPAHLQAIETAFKPSGPIDLTFELERRDGGWSQRCTINPQGMAAEYEDFRYPLRDVRGELVQVTTSTGLDRLEVNLTGRAAGQEISITGYSLGDGPNTQLELQAHGRNIPFDEDLLKAMGEYRRPAEALHPAGRGDFHLHVRRRPGESCADTDIRVDLHDLAICFDPFPYPLEEMSGRLHVTIGKRNRVEFESFRGRHHGGEVTINGFDDIAAAGTFLSLQVEATGIPFDAELARAAGHLHLQSAWKALGPRGRLNLSARITNVEHTAPPNAPKAPGEMEIVFERLQADALLPEFMPYELTHVSTAGRYSGNRFTFSEFRARHGSSRLLIGPTMLAVKPEGGMQVRFERIQLTPIVPDEEFLGALPPNLRGLCASLEPSGPMSLSAGVVIVDLARAPEERERPRLQARQLPDRTVRMSSASLPEPESSPWIYWNNLSLQFAGAALRIGVRCENVFGEVTSTGAYRNGRLGAVVGNLELTHAAVLRQPFQNVHAELLMDPERAPGVLQVRNLKADVYGGNIVGQGGIRFEPTLRYELNLNAVQLRMEEIARHNQLTSEQLNGRAHAQLYLKGQGGDLATLEGGGRFDIPKGRINDLPPLLDLLKFVKLRPPDGTMFSEAHTKFKIQGDRVHFEQFDLIGDLVSLTGTGDMNLDGTHVKLEVYPIWSRLVQGLPGPVREGANALSHGLYKIGMTGSLGGKLDFRSEALPVITDPVRRMIERLRQSGGREN
jgi:hypothetical protein